MTDVVGLAQRLFDRSRCDPIVRAALEREYQSLVLGIIDGSKGFDINSGSKNGGHYTVKVGFSVSVRESALRLALDGLQSGIRPSRTAHARFR